MNKIKFYWDIVSPILITLATAIIVFFIVGLVLSIPLCLLWNWLMPHIFGLPTLTLIETFGLSLLISLLSPRKVSFGNKEKDEYQSDENYQEANKKLEEVLKNLSSQFSA